jgi:hypothetical protein
MLAGGSVDVLVDRSIVAQRNFHGLCKLILSVLPAQVDSPDWRH